MVHAIDDDGLTMQAEYNAQKERFHSSILGGDPGFDRARYAL